MTQFPEHVTGFPKILTKKLMTERLAVALFWSFLGFATNKLFTNKLCLIVRWSLFAKISKQASMACLFAYFLAKLFAMSNVLWFCSFLSCDEIDWLMSRQLGVWSWFFSKMKGIYVASFLLLAMIAHWKLVNSLVNYHIAKKRNYLLSLSYFVLITSKPFDLYHGHLSLALLYVLFSVSWICWKINVLSLFKGMLLIQQLLLISWENGWVFVANPSHFCV